MSRYTWITPRFQRLADAQSVGEALETIEKRDGALRPDVVVSEASDPESPLHGCFTWDDTEAARKHRESEARALIRSIRIEVRIKGQGKQTRRKWINVTVDEGEEETHRGYVSINRLGRNEEASEAVVAEAVRGLRQWVHRYNELRVQLPGLFDAIDKVLADHIEAE